MSGLVVGGKPIRLLEMVEGMVVGERACCCRWWVVNRKVVGDGWW